MRKGVFFTMDAVFALYIAFLFMSTMMVLLESGKNYSNDSLTIVRLSRDVYEVKKYAPGLELPNVNITFVKTGSACDGKDYISSAIVLGYNDTAYDASWQSKSNVTTKFEKVCING